MGETGAARQAEPGPDPRPEVLASGRDGPGARELWSAVPVRLRRTALAAAFLMLLAAGAYALSTQAPGAQPRPQPASGSPTAEQAPYPAQAARITFTRLRLDDPVRRTFTVELRATATSPLTVLRVGQNYEAVDLRLAGHAPAAVRPGHPRTLVLHGGVTNCDGVPLRARSPFLDVTLRNERARQKQSVIPGERYTRALTHAFRTLCGPSRTASAPNP